VFDEEVGGGANFEQVIGMRVLGKHVQREVRELKLEMEVWRCRRRGTLEPL